jgi:CubicO group peptidase (beta-lactamase class C family)
VASTGDWPASTPDAEGGLYMRPRDMAKLGTLMVTGGRWRGRAVISNAWIRESTQRIVVGPRSFGAHALDYGYLWWILDLADPMNPRPQAGDVITASGARGQWIFAIPRDDLVMISTAENGDTPNANRPTDFLYTHVLAAVRH